MSRKIDLNQPVLSLDVETTGLEPDRNQVLEIGAVIDYHNDTRALEEMPTFHCLVRPTPYIVGNEYALQLNNRILRKLAGVDKTDELILGPQEAMEQLVEFMKSYLPPGSKRYTPAGKNFASFDRPFLVNTADYDTGRAFDKLLAHRTMDPAMFYWNPALDGYNLPDLTTCLHRAGLTPTDLHTAVGDAQDVIRLIWAYKSARSEMLNDATGYAEERGFQGNEATYLVDAGKTHPRKGLLDLLDHLTEDEKTSLHARMNGQYL